MVHRKYIFATFAVFGLLVSLGPINTRSPLRITPPVQADTAQQPLSWENRFWNLPNPSRALTTPPVIPNRSPDAVSQSDTIAYDLGVRSPHPSINRDRYVARFHSDAFLQSGTYTFTTQSDDGIRLMIDDYVLIDAWNDHGAAIHSTTVRLSEARHQFTIEYYENGGESLVTLDTYFSPDLAETSTAPDIQAAAAQFSRTRASTGTEEGWHTQSAFDESSAQVLTATQTISDPLAALAESIVGAPRNDNNDDDGGDDDTDEENSALPQDESGETDDPTQEQQELPFINPYSVVQFGTNGTVRPILTQFGSPSGQTVDGSYAYTVEVAHNGGPDCNWCTSNGYPNDDLSLSIQLVDAGTSTTIASLNEQTTQRYGGNVFSLPFSNVPDGTYDIYVHLEHTGGGYRDRVVRDITKDSYREDSYVTPEPEPPVEYETPAARHLLVAVHAGQEQAVVDESFVFRASIGYPDSNVEEFAITALVHNAADGRLVKELRDVELIPANTQVSPPTPPLLEVPFADIPDGVYNVTIYINTRDLVSQSSKKTYGITMVRTVQDEVDGPGDPEDDPAVEEHEDTGAVVDDFDSTYDDKTVNEAPTPTVFTPVFTLLNGAANSVVDETFVFRGSVHYTTDVPCNMSCERSDGIKVSGAIHDNSNGRTMYYIGDIQPGNHAPYVAYDPSAPAIFEIPFSLLPDGEYIITIQVTHESSTGGIDGIIEKNITKITSQPQQIEQVHNDPEAEPHGDAAIEMIEPEEPPVADVDTDTPELLPEESQPADE